MSARLCHAHHPAAVEALGRIKCALSSGQLTGGSPLQVFVRLCFAALNNPASRAHSNLGSFSDVLTTLRSLSVAARPDKPIWVTESEIVLHLSERLLGVASLNLNWGQVPSEELRAHRIRQRSCGTYSTPNYVADALSDCVVSELRHDGFEAAAPPARVVDLSIEGGHFALSMLARKPSLPVEFVGFDRDPEAVSLSRALMKRAARVGGRHGFFFEAHRRDSVRDSASRDLIASVDAVIGNPPWKTNHPTDKAELLQLYKPLLRARFDVYLAFILRADALLRPGGVMAFVLPSSFLYNDNAAGVRGYLLDRYDPIQLRTYRRRTFIELPSIAPVVIALRKKRPGRPRRRLTTIASHTSLNEVNAPKAVRRVHVAPIWAAHPRKIFCHTSGQTTLWPAAHIDCAALTELGSFSSGARLSSRQKVKTSTGFASVSAKCLTQFHTCGRKIIRFDPGDGSFARLPPLEHLPASKVFFQTVRCVSLPKRLVAAAGGAGQLACSTAAMFMPNRVQDVGFVAGLLNSTFANAWYKSNDHNHAIKISVLGKLQVPLDEDVWRQISDLSRKIEVARAHTHAKAQHCTSFDWLLRSELEPNRSELRVRDLYHRLDDLIFELYRIPYAERLRISALSGQRAL